MLKPPDPHNPVVQLSAELVAAFGQDRAVVVFESSVLAQGLAAPSNREAARRMTAAVRDQGAIPAFAAVIRGAPTIGLDDADLERLLDGGGVTKISARDLPWAIASGADGATTVAATLALCALAGAKVFATGGIGGVHHGRPRDESADLLELSRTRVVTVCSGAKSILDVPATVERLETLGVSVVGYGTDEFPGFLSAHTGLRVAARADSPTEVANIWRAHVELRRPGALLVVQPPPAAVAIGAASLSAAVDVALEEARVTGVSGSALTPFLLRCVSEATGGRSLEANLGLLECNARLAAEIASALARAP